MLLNQSSPRKAIVVDMSMPIDKEKFVDGLKSLAFKECGKNSEESWGFVPPDDSGSWDILPTIEQYWVLTLRRDRRIPGKSRLARERHIAIKKREAELSKRLTKDEKDAVTEAVKKNLLQFYPPDETIMQAVYASTSRKLYVLESSLPKAKYFVDKIDRALKPQNTSISFSEDSLKPVLDETLTSWVHHSTKLPSEYGFEVGRSMRLESEGNSAVLSGQDSDTAEVREHLHANKRVSSVALTWKDNVDFTLSSKRIISAIDMKKFCGESLKSVKAECQEDIRAYEQGTLLVYISTLEDLCDAVYSIPSELDV